MILGPWNQQIEKVYGKRFKHNIVKFSKVFTLLTVQLSDGLKKAFSSHLLKQKLSTLLHKFRQVYELTMLTQILCKHEVALLSVRCYSLGNWFPYPFPEQKLSRKFHVLSCHVPEKAKHFHTVGLYSENIAESIHPVVNKLKRRYSSVAYFDLQRSVPCKQSKCT